ncbi:hypothetical protein [Flavobacterium pedocola]
MKTFEDLQNVWNQQSNPSTDQSASDYVKKAEQHQNEIRSNHVWTIGIISITFLILVGYFVWIGIYRFNAFSLGLGIMMLMLLTRIALEVVSIRKFRNIKPDSTLLTYAAQLQQFYNWRKRIHFILTPIIYITYFIGFTILLPVFKENMSSGFYLYVVISGFAFFIGFGLFIMSRILKEIKLLNFLKTMK